VRKITGTATFVIAYTETVSDRVSRGASLARRATLPQTTAAFLLSLSLSLKYLETPSH